MKHKIRRLTGEKRKYSEENETLYREWVMYEEEKQGKQSISDSVRGKALTAYAAKKEERKGNSLNLPGPSPRGLTKISSFHGPTLTNPLLLTGRVKADLVLLSLYCFIGNSLCALLSFVHSLVDMEALVPR